MYIARAPEPGASTRVLFVHGVGGHNRALWPIAAPVASRGIDISTIDLPLYGRTRSLDPAAVRHDTRVDPLTDLVEAERDHRPPVFLGTSIGGLLSYGVVAYSPHVTAVAATCLSESGNRCARAHTMRAGTLGALGGSLSMLARGGLAYTMVSMSAMTNLRRMSHDRTLSRLRSIDSRGGVARVPLGLLASYLRFTHTPPGRDRTPVTLLHPGRDVWTPIELSARFLSQTAGPADLIVLHECGRLPVGDLGLTELVDVVANLARRLGSHGEA